MIQNQDMDTKDYSDDPSTQMCIVRILQHKSYILLDVGQAREKLRITFLQLIKFAHIAMLAYYCCMITLWADSPVM